MNFFSADDIMSSPIVSPRFPPSRRSLEREMDDIAEFDRSGQRGGTRCTSPTDEQKLKELMCMKGTLTALTTSVKEAALEVHFDVVKTIGKLLFENQMNKEEMRRIGGYRVFIKLFDIAPDYSSPEAQVFLKVSYVYVFY